MILERKSEDLETLRAQLDDVDERILALLAERFQIIRTIAQFKKRNAVAVMQPARVAALMSQRAQRAVELGLSPRLVQRIWGGLISEACRVENEVVGGDNRTLQAQAIRIDHVAVAVRELDAAVDFYRDHLGFDVVERWSIDGAYSGMNAAVLEAGPVTFVLVEGTSAQSNVSRYIDHYGPGVQHIAIEVDDIVGARDELDAREFPMIGGIYDVDGLQQMFSRREPNSGLQIEIVCRGSPSRFEPDNVRNLFEAMQRENVF